MPFAPPQGISHEVNASTPLQRGTSPLEIWYSGVVNQTAYGTAAPTVGSLRAFPIVIGRSGTVDRVAFEVTTVGGAGAVARAGIYNCNQTPPNYYPTSLLVDTGEFATDSGTTKVYTPSTAIYVSAGIYWVCMLQGVNAATVRTASAASMMPFSGIPSTMGANPTRGWQVAQAYGALPSTFPAGAVLNTSSSSSPLVHIRLSS